VADTLLTVPLLAAAAAAAAATVLLAHRTVRYWRNQLAGRPYELPVDRLGAALRATAATTTAALAATLTVTVLHAGPAPHTTAEATASRPATAAHQPPRTAAPPPPPPRTPEPAPPPPEVRTAGHPAGGTLQVLRDGTRVWLPPYYDSPRAAAIAYPVVVAHTGDDPDLYDGFVLGARQHEADLFVLVMPPLCAPAPGSQGPSPDTVLAEVASRYRTLTSVKARGVLGVGAQASCAVQEALTSAGRYGAAAGVSGTYGAPPSPAAGKATAAWTGAAAHPPLLLATGAGEDGARDSGRRFRTALHPQGDAVRVLDGIAPRKQLFAEVAAYFTEKLDGPSRITHPHT